MQIKCRIGLKNLSEITRAEIVGAPEREIQVNVDPYKMQAGQDKFYGY